MDENSLSGEHFETRDVGFGTALKWLIYKNFKQQFLRRPCALACKLLCPAICVIIIGLIREGFDASSPSTYYPTSIYTNDVTPSNIQSRRWIDQAICYKDYGANQQVLVFYIYKFNIQHNILS